MTLPNFIIVGAMKAATTSLASYLGSHPQIFMCEPKEPSFFSRDDPGIKEFEAYESLFADAQGIAIGEASTDYTKAPTIRGVPARDLPDWYPRCG